MSLQQLYQPMFSNKQSTSNRINRIVPALKNSQRSKTPNNQTRSKNDPVSYSLSKNNIAESTTVSKQNLLTPITEQIVYERPYFLGKGNNHELIRRVLNKRKGWGEVVNQEFVYLKWTQGTQNFKFHLLGKEVYCFNHFQYHRELSNKQRLVQNMSNFCESNKLNVYNYVPVTYIIDLTTGQQDLTLHSFIKFYNRNHPDVQQSSSKRYHSIILPRAKNYPYYSAQQLNKRSQGNFYCKPICPKSFIDPQNKPYIWILKPTFLNRGRGVALFRTLDELQKMIWKYYGGEGLQDFSEKNLFQDSVIQKISPEQHKDQQKQKNQEEQKEQNHTKKQQQSPQKQSYQKLTHSQPIIKSEISPPPKNSNTNQKQGTKTSLQKSDKKIEQKMNKSLQNIKEQQQKMNNNYSSVKNNSNVSAVPKCLNFIIQKYIEQPMLIQNRKFDIRVWVLLTHTLQVYMFQQAYLRFSSYDYSTKSNHNNPFIHLTNNSVQKYSNQYDKNTGNQVALSDIVKYIQPKHKAQSIYNSITKKIKDIVWLSMCSVRRKININSRKICFQLFGYDFMIDKDYKVWLIEVNTNPALQQSGTLLKSLLPRMVDDMFKLTIDKILNNCVKQDAQVFSVQGKNDNNNMFQFIGDLKQGNTQKNSRRMTFVRR